MIIIDKNLFDTKDIVTKSNGLIESKYKLTLQQQKFICAVASKVQITDTDFTEYNFHIKELAELFELDPKGYYSEVRKIIRSLQTQVFTIHKIVDGEIKNVDLNWFYRAEYNETRGTVSVKFAEDLKPFLIKLNSNFTSYKLENIIRLSSSYSIRIYEILKSKSFKNKCELSLEELYSMVVNKYDRYSDFKKNILEKCKKELAEKTDINFTYTEIKTGRKVTSIKFTIKQNSKDKVKNEIAIDKADPEETIDTEVIAKVLKIIKLHKVEPIEAKKIYDVAKGNFENIERCYTYCCEMKVNSIVAYMLKLVKPNEFIGPKGNIPLSNFANYEQRDYDINELERKLLGWK